MTFDQCGKKGCTLPKSHEGTCYNRHNDTEIGIAPILLWENIGTGEWRAKVPGGWLVKITEEVIDNLTSSIGSRQTGFEWRPALAFIPDPSHEWE